jgi:hypothetical protein
LPYSPLSTINSLIFTCSSGVIAAILNTSRRSASFLAFAASLSSL